MVDPLPLFFFLLFLSKSMRKPTCQIWQLLPVTMIQYESSFLVNGVIWLIALRFTSATLHHFHPRGQMHLEITWCNRWRHPALSRQVATLMGVLRSLWSRGQFHHVIAFKASDVTPALSRPDARRASKYPRISRLQSCLTLVVYIWVAMHFLATPVSLESTQCGEKKMYTLHPVNCRGHRCVCNYTCPNLPTKQVRKRCVKCVSLCTFFKRDFCPITFEQKNGVQPKFYYGLRSSSACLLQNESSQNPIVLAEKCLQCAGVRPSFPYYRVRIM